MNKINLLRDLIKEGLELDTIVDLNTKQLTVLKKRIEESLADLYREKAQNLEDFEEKDAEIIANIENAQKSTNEEDVVEDTDPRFHEPKKYKDAEGNEREIIDADLDDLEEDLDDLEEETMWNGAPIEEPSFPNPEASGFQSEGPLGYGSASTGLYGEGLTKSKAKKMLDDGTSHGRKLTDKQIRYFNMIANEADEDLDESIDEWVLDLVEKNPLAEMSKHKLVKTIKEMEYEVEDIDVDVEDAKYELPAWMDFNSLFSPESGPLTMPSPTTKPTTTPLKTPKKPGRKTPYQPKHRPKPKARK